MNLSAFKVVATLLLIFASCITTRSHAQDGTDTASATSEDLVLTTEGISGDSDKKRRGPVLSVSAHHRETTASKDGNSGSKITLLVDAFVPNEEYKSYPIRFDFYVNRNLVASQLRSTELPGPIGLDVTPEMATIPFNYSVVATLLSPNREFTTVLNAAVTSATPPTPKGDLSTCTLELLPIEEGAETTIYVANSVKVTPKGSGTYEVMFETATLDNNTQGDPITATAKITVTSEGTASGTLTTSLKDTPKTTTISGSATVTGATLRSIDVESENRDTALACM